MFILGLLIGLAVGAVFSVPIINLVKKLKEKATKETQD